MCPMGVLGNQTHDSLIRRRQFAVPLSCNTQFHFSHWTACGPNSAWWYCPTDRLVGLKLTKLMTWWQWGNFLNLLENVNDFGFHCARVGVFGGMYTAALCLGDFALYSWMNHLLLFFFLVMFCPSSVLSPSCIFFFFLPAEHFTETTGLGKDDREHHVCLLTSNTKQQCRPLTLESTHILLQKPVEFLSLPPSWWKISLIIQRLSYSHAVIVNILVFKASRFSNEWANDLEKKYSHISMFTWCNKKATNCCWLKVEIQYS